MGNVYEDREGDQQFEDALKEYLLSDDSEETKQALEAGAEWAAAGGVVDEVVDPKKEKEALEKLKKAASKGKGMGMAGTTMSYLLVAAVSGSIGYYVINGSSANLENQEIRIDPSYVNNVVEEEDGFDLKDNQSSQEVEYIAQAEPQEITHHRPKRLKDITTTKEIPAITQEKVTEAEEAAEEAETSIEIPGENLKYESKGVDKSQVSGTKVVHDPGAYYDPNEVEQVSDQPFESENKDVNYNIPRLTVDSDWSSVEGTYRSTEHNYTYKLRSKQGVVYGKGRRLEEFIVVTIERDGTTKIAEQQYAEPISVYFVRDMRGKVIGFKYKDVYINTLFKKVD